MAINLGYIYHPAVLMWLGYEESLKNYLNAHIKVSIERGIKNQMQFQMITDPVIDPPWINDPDFLARHRGVLLHKEITRHEKAWYQLNPLFTTDLNKDVDYKYYSPFAIQIGNNAKIQGEADIQRRYEKSHIPS